MRLLEFGVCLALPLAVPAQNLQAVLARMDLSAPGFRGITADLLRVSYTAVIKDTVEEHAVFSLSRARPNQVRFLADFTRPDPKTVVFAGRTLEVFTPKINTVQEFDLGKHRGLVETFLLLGFGSSGRDLTRAYTVKFIADDSVSGQKCSRLELTPKSQQVREHFKTVELCIADPGGYPVRQKLLEPNGNFILFQYSNVRINPSLADGQLTLKTPPNVRREYPQK